MNNFETATLLKKLRKDCNYTIQKIANLLDVSKAAVSKWESGYDIKTEHLYELSKLYNVSFSELYYGKLKKEKNADYIEVGKKEVQKTKKYDFTKFVSGISDAKLAEKKALKSKKENFAAVTAGNDNYDINREFDPVQTDNSDSKYLFDNENAIIVNFKNKKK